MTPRALERDSLVFAFFLVLGTVAAMATALLTPGCTALGLKEVDVRFVGSDGGLEGGSDSGVREAGAE